tara:strand:- start:154 stop:681 length:528 start_codon:yes stop_codon:yes gene_type:complete
MKILSKSFKDHLLKNTDQEFVNKLIPHLEGVNIINASLSNGIIGIAKPELIYLNLETAMRINGKYGLAFVILHELAHYKRIKKKGKEWYLNYVLRSDEETYIKHTILEERIADKWGLDMVKKIYGITVCNPRNPLISSKEFYRKTSAMYKGIRSCVKTEDDWNNMLNSYVLNVRQ